MYNDERTVIRELQNYAKSQFVKRASTKESDGSVFYNFGFIYKGTEGYITSTYLPNKKAYKNIDMDCNFCRPAGYNNYIELKQVMDHILYLFKLQ
ncbi:hypothetical protein [Intestinibacter bartlettii]|uniref:hypothetical protein n=1 Tax=Intestinibacter bartlettii TaxID=261299 RepID=UPI00082177D8|nr:hypothetical protein [Intestinibacter bartlettii]SCI46556.1 Uncharacterised protein [uncultured Clostridium sp.]